MDQVPFSVILKGMKIFIPLSDVALTVARPEIPVTATEGPIWSWEQDASFENSSNTKCHKFIHVVHSKFRRSTLTFTVLSHGMAVMNYTGLRKQLPWVHIYEDATPLLAPETGIPPIHPRVLPTTISPVVPCQQEIGQVIVMYASERLRKRSGHDEGTHHLRDS